MPTFGKPDATGRSSGKLTGRCAKHLRPPEGSAWSWLTDELLNSLAWRSQGINCHRLICFLMLEHCRHAGQDNGNLMALYTLAPPGEVKLLSLTTLQGQLVKIGARVVRHGRYITFQPAEIVV